MKILKNIVLPLLFVALAATAAVLVIFASYHGDNGLAGTVQVKGITFGAYEHITVIGGTTVITKLDDYGPSVMPLIGWILIVVGLLAGGVAAFLGGKSKQLPIILICAAALVLVGSVFQFFALQSFASVTAKVNHQDYKDVLDGFKSQDGKITLCTVAGILGIVSSLVLAVRALLPAKK